MRKIILLPIVIVCLLVGCKNNNEQIILYNDVLKVENGGKEYFDPDEALCADGIVENGFTHSRVNL